MALITYTHTYKSLEYTTTTNINEHTGKYYTYFSYTLHTGAESIPYNNRHEYPSGGDPEKDFIEYDTPEESEQGACKELAKRFDNDRLDRL